MESFLEPHFPNQDEPGACLMIARRGVIEQLECRGTANLAEGSRIGPETNFRLASITKQFTAAAVLLLREQGRLRLEDPLKSYFPDFPRWGAESMTLRHLLQHTSGMLDFEDHLPPEQTEAALDADVLEITKSHTETYFPPGTQFRYSNTGYALLACVVEKLTVRPFAVALEEMIFGPLGMTATVALDARHRPHVPHRAYGYLKKADGSFVEADQSRTSSVLGDGGVYCSANDYLLWDRALWEGSLLPSSVVEEMMTPGRLQRITNRDADGRVWFPDDMQEGRPGEVAEACVLAGGELTEEGCDIPYGLGWRLETNDAGMPVAYHPGSTTGFMHCVRRAPGEQLTILMLANRSIAQSKELARAVEKRMIETNGKRS